MEIVDPDSKDELVTSGSTFLRTWSRVMTLLTISRKPNSSRGKSGDVWKASNRRGVAYGKTDRSWYKGNYSLPEFKNGRSSCLTERERERERKEHALSFVNIELSRLKDFLGTWDDLPIERLATDWFSSLCGTYAIIFIVYSIYAFEIEEIKEKWKKLNETEKPRNSLFFFRNKTRW